MPWNFSTSVAKGLKIKVFWGELQFVEVTGDKLVGDLSATLSWIGLKSIAKILKDVYYKEKTGFVWNKCVVYVRKFFDALIDKKKHWKIALQ